MIVCDLDGTLLNDKQTIDAENVKMIKQVINQGDLFIIASGREWRDIQPYYHQLQLEQIKPIVICNNGASIIKPYDDNFIPITLPMQRAIYQQILSLEVINHATDFVLIHHTNGFYINQLPKDTYLKQKLNQLFHLHFEDNSIQEIKEQTLINSAKTSDILRVCILIKDNVDVKPLICAIKNNFHQLDIMEWSLKTHHFHKTILEITGAYTNKLTGVNIAKSYYGIADDNVYFFGDGVNDLKCLHKLNHGYVMPNAPFTHHLVANQVALADNNHSGVGKTLKVLYHHHKNHQKLLKKA